MDGLALLASVDLVDKTDLVKRNVEIEVFDDE